MQKDIINMKIRNLRLKPQIQSNLREKKIHKHKNEIFKEFK